jgi:hypothetical protein
MTLPPADRGRPPARASAMVWRRWIGLALVCASASAAIVYPAITKVQLYDAGFGGREGDVGQYVRIYQGAPLAQVTRPFRYRVLGPMVARVVPVPPASLLRFFDMNPERIIQLHFGVANWVALALDGLLLIALSEAFGLSLIEGLLAALLFYTSMIVINFGGTPMAEAWAWTFLLLGLLGAVRGSIAMLLVSSLIGMFAKETTLLLLPAVALLAAPARTTAIRLLALLPGVAAYAIFRFHFFPGGYGIPDDPLTAFANLADRVGRSPWYWLWLAFDGATAFGLLWPLAALGLRELQGQPAHPLARLTWLAAVVFVIPFWSGTNVGRIWFYAFPVVIPLAVLGLRAMLRTAARRPLSDVSAPPPAPGTSPG